MPGPREDQTGPKCCCDGFAHDLYRVSKLGLDAVLLPVLFRTFGDCSIVFQRQAFLNIALWLTPLGRRGRYLLGCCGLRVWPLGRLIVKRIIFQRFGSIECAVRQGVFVGDAHAFTVHLARQRLAVIVNRQRF